MSIEEGENGRDEVLGVASFFQNTCYVFLCSLIPSIYFVSKISKIREEKTKRRKDINFFTDSQQHNYSILRIAKI